MPLTFGRTIFVDKVMQLWLYLTLFIQKILFPGPADTLCQWLKELEASCSAMAVFKVIFDIVSAKLLSNKLKLALTEKILKKQCETSNKR